MSDNEKKHFWDVVIKFICIGIFATLYCLGGAEFGWGKWLRRFIAPIFLTGVIYYFSRDIRCLIQLILILPLTLGYGSEKFIIKILKRSVYALAVGAGSISYEIIRKNWLVVVYHGLIVFFTIVIFGVFNKLPNARTEEFFFGVIICLIPILSAKYIKPLSSQNNANT